MKKHFLLAGLLAALPVSAAQAALYAGADFGANSIDLKDNAPNLYPEGALGLGVHIGEHFNSWAVELGYSTNRNNYQQTDLRINRLTGDGILYLPVGGFLNLLATAGMSESNFGASTYTRKPYTQDGIIKSTRVATTLLNGDAFDWRAGTGLSFSFANGYEFHVIGRYEPLTMKGLANYALSLDTGINIDLN